MLVKENNKVTGKFICRFGRRKEKEDGSGRRAFCPQIALMISFLGTLRLFKLDGSITSK